MVFFMSGKFKTFGALLSYETRHEIVNVPDHAGWSETKRKRQKRFYFPDASEIFAMGSDSIPNLVPREKVLGTRLIPFHS